MAKTVILGCMTAAATLLTPFAQATNLAATKTMTAAVQEINVTQKVPYTCRQGRNGRECTYISSSDRSRSDSQPSNNGNPYFQKRYTGSSQYQAHPWGAPYGQD